MEHFGVCEACGQGAKRLRACASERHFLILCDECDAVWITLEDDKPTYLKQPDLPCPACDASLVQPPSRWATLDEIRQLGWGDDLESEQE